jgi:hypothetical protein
VSAFRACARDVYADAAQICAQHHQDPADFASRRESFSRFADAKWCWPAIS